MSIMEEYDDLINFIVNLEDGPQQAIDKVMANFTEREILLNITKLTTHGIYFPSEKLSLCISILDLCLHQKRTIRQRFSILNNNEFVGIESDLIHAQNINRDIILSGLLIDLLELLLDEEEPFSDEEDEEEEEYKIKQSDIQGECNICFEPKNYILLGTNSSCSQCSTSKCCLDCFQPSLKKDVFSCGLCRKKHKIII